MGCGVAKGVLWGSSCWDSNATERGSEREGSELDVSWSAARRRGTEERESDHATDRLRHTPPTDCDIRHRPIAIYANDNGLDWTRLGWTERCQARGWDGKDSEDRKGTGGWDVAHEIIHFVLVLVSPEHREVEEEGRDG